MSYTTTLNFLSEIPILGGKEATLCLLHVFTEVELTRDSLRITNEDALGIPGIVSSILLCSGSGSLP